MKEITIQDCKDLHEKFIRYTDTAEQHQFAMLFFTQIRLEATIAHFESIGKVDDQEMANTMFRVILRIIDEPFDEYEKPAPVET